MSNQQKFASWQALRQAELIAPESWLGLKALAWLEPGQYSVGSGNDCQIVLSDGPALSGQLTVENAAVFWQYFLENTLATDLQWLNTDREGAPSLIVIGGLNLTVIEREGKLALRVRDLSWSGGQSIEPLSYFDYDPAWEIEARWEKLETPLEMSVPSVTGGLDKVMVENRAVFELAGQTVHLLPVSVSDQEVFFVFRDRTSGKDSYGAGRFLKANATATVHGTISLNFNYAYNPPCAFTAFATCPLPPPENWLPFPVIAGEKKWQGKG